MLVSFIISTTLNVALLGQYVYYNFVAKKAAAGKKVGPSAKPAAMVAEAPAPAPKDEEPEAPASASSSRRNSVRRRA